MKKLLATAFIVCVVAALTIYIIVNAKDTSENISVTGNNTQINLFGFAGNYAQHSDMYIDKCKSN